MNDNSGIDDKEEACMRILLARLNHVAQRVSHCHECGFMDPIDAYRPLCDLGHAMQPCMVTKYRLVVSMAAYN